MHGARLLSEAAFLGAPPWRLDLGGFPGTFALFPVVVMPAHRLASGFLPPPLWAGVILLAALPSTVQASIAFTSVAGGHGAAALFHAPASHLLGAFPSPP